MLLHVWVPIFDIGSQTKILISDLYIRLCLGVDNSVTVVLIMVFSKVEVNLRRLLEAAPRQQNQAKLVHVCVAPQIVLDLLNALHFCLASEQTLLCNVL
jgi:hypothetical protein